MRRRILLVEVEMSTAMEVEEMAEALGYQVAARVKTGEEALTSAERLRPDAVIMDIVLPGEVDGIAAAERIVEGLDIPVIFLTSHTEPEFLHQAARVRHSGYFVKPFHRQQLAAAVILALQGDRIRKSDANNHRSAARVYELLSIIQNLRESRRLLPETLRRIATLAPFLCPVPDQIKAHIILNGNTHGPELDPNVFCHRRFPIVCGDQLQGYLKMYLAPNGSQDPSGPLCPDSACIPAFLAAHLGTLFEWSELKAIAHERASRLSELESEILRTSAALEGLARASHPADTGLSKPADAPIYPFSLTPREWKIAEMIRDGRSTGSIAASLGISPMTVKTHRKRIRRKLGIQTLPVHFQTHLKQILK